MNKKINVDELFNQISNQSGARYVNRKGRRIKTVDYQVLDPQIKEELEMPSDNFDWTSIDLELDELNKKWNKESNQLKKKILEIKYDLCIELGVGDNPVKIKELKSRLRNLEMQAQMVKMP